MKKRNRNHNNNLSFYDRYWYLSHVVSLIALAISIITLILKQV